MTSLFYHQRWSRQPRTPRMQQCWHAAVRARPGARLWRLSPRCGRGSGRSQRPGWRLWGGTMSAWQHCSSDRRWSWRSCWTNTLSWGAITAAWRPNTESWRPGANTQSLHSIRSIYKVKNNPDWGVFFNPVRAFSFRQETHTHIWTHLLRLPASITNIQCTIYHNKGPGHIFPKALHIP